MIIHLVQVTTSFYHGSTYTGMLLSCMVCEGHNYHIRIIQLWS